MRTKENAQILRKVGIESGRLAVDILDHSKSFKLNCDSVGERCEEFWPAIQSSSETAKTISDEAAKTLFEYSKLMEQVAKKIETVIGSGAL